MKRSTLISACAAIALVFAASSVSATSDSPAVNRYRDDFNRRFTLPHRALVDVSGINGSVDIKAIDGDTAIVEIERTARSQAELDCNRVVVEHTSGRLTIESESGIRQGCPQTIQVRHRLRVSLPRYVDVDVHGVSGPVNIGEIEGALHISGNSGTIDLEQSGRGSSITGNSGTTTIRLRKLDAGGLELSGNDGAIRLYIGDELGVDVRVTGLMGSMSNELPNARVIKTGAADYHARVGSGGPTISVDHNSGGISLIRYRE